MIINHNMASLNTYRQLSANNVQTGKALEKLSSGLRINKAGDDAAGLAISEKMRGQIRGLDQATRNSQDAISMINTAEGSLSETHSILQRMKELATQAASDTNVGVDRNEIQKEINQLTSEINRIGNTTEFNTQKLLNGGGVDPTSAATGGAKLSVPVQLSGGLAGGPTQAAATFTFTAIGAAAGSAAALDGSSMELKIGDRKLTVAFDSTADYSNVSGNTITLKTADNESAVALGTDLGNQLTSLITADDSLRGNYTVSVNSGTGAVSITSVGATYDNATGQLTGNINNGVVSGTDSSGLTGGIALTASAGAQASNTIDFSNLTKEDLVGSGIIVNDKKIDFYDSSKGAYTGTANYSVDLNGARTPEKIVDAIVDAMKGSTAVTDTGVWFSKTDANKLQVTAATSGIAGNDIKLYNNAVDKVNTVYSNDRLANEGVQSARGLADGEQKVTITNVAAAITEGTATDGGGGATDANTIASMTIASNSTLNGSYRLLATAADTFKLQELGDNGVWADMTGDYAGTLTVGDGTTSTKGDITITWGATSATDGDVDAADAGTTNIQFGIVNNHYEATLTESGSASAGTAVTVTNGQTGVTLQAADGVGEAVVNIGTFDTNDFEIGESIKFSFDTKQGTASNEVVGGKFEATFQIGANMGQSMSIEINDMRSQALQVAGTTAGGKASVEGAVFTATKDVSNGTDNTGVEYALDVSSYEKATAAIKVINNAIESVSAERSKLGAYTNRLEHTITNLGTSSENLTAAESRIRDVDMAKEMMNFQKNNILSQAAQAMLAQANQQPQGVLQLLR